MNKKIIISAVVIGLVALVSLIALAKTDQPSKTNNPTNNIQNNNVEGATPKEFSMTSFVEMVNEKPKPQFSLKEIIVNKGDKVRIKVTVTKGVHDFKIDEFNVYSDTKELNQEYVIEFVADKAGEFTYYCTKPGHRQNGHWGILKVLES